MLISIAGGKPSDLSMNHRENLKECFQERLEATKHDVKVIMNQIERMESQYKSISPSVIEKDLATSYCDLELSMALMAVIIRKMVENQYVTITNSERQDINALIHSNRLDYKDGKVMVYSRMSKESVEVAYFLTLGQRLLESLELLTKNASIYLLQ